MTNKQLDEGVELRKSIDYSTERLNRLKQARSLESLNVSYQREPVYIQESASPEILEICIRHETANLDSLKAKFEAL